MTDIRFPAHISVDREVDLDGVPVLTASVTVAEDVAELPLPPGPEGLPGPQGRPRTTFLKMGDIADIAARPAGLGAEDRGKWWHRLDDDGMDVWTGTGWQHSPNAVGPQGEIAAAATIEVADTVHNENLVSAGVEFSGAGAQFLEVTVPAGDPGAQGPSGASGTVATAPDYDATIGPANRSPFAYSTTLRKFRAMPPPNGYGPWSWYENDFTADAQSATDKLTAGTFTVPGLPFEWRPICYGFLYAYIEGGSGSHYFRLSVRLLTSEGVVVAGYRSKFNGSYLYLPLTPLYADNDSTKTLAPTSKYATVPAGQEGKLVVLVERLGVSSGSSIQIGYQRQRASLTVYAQPV